MGNVGEEEKVSLISRVDVGDFVHKLSSGIVDFYQASIH